ncbi:MAG TPA: choice-of-anchor tandem repeat GloVer-containing protein, partial [Verrucomicrobiae bacterium]|nr:choice-of-anchor tandem repeat GloVer-containing protein [Verrucomicrobiae bacterium]
GTLYGVIRNGGPSSLGSIYKIDTNGVFSTLVTINDTNDAAPSALVLGSDNNFYGLAAQSSGFSVFAGSIFRMDRNGNLTNIYLFSDLGGEPDWLMQGSDGDLYGLTAFGGTNGLGSIFRVTTNGVLVWSFSFNGTNGYGPLELTAANDGNFYGVTDRGGPNYTPNTIGDGAGYGTVFRITPGGSFTSLVQFDGANDSQPATIAQGTDGNLYGATQGGGTYGQGAIFKLCLPKPAQVDLMVTSLVPLTGTNGSQPQGELTFGSDGLLYGSAGQGGAFGQGTIFNVTLGGSLTPLCSFNGTNGSFPVFGPLLAGSSSCYGITLYGGNGFNGNNYTGQGTVYQLTSNGVLNTLFAFSGTNGTEPTSLTFGSDGNLYGTTSAGGAYTNDPNNNFAGDGTAFEITTNGQFTLLTSFDSTNGETPRALLQGKDGNFYGVGESGGAYGYGTVFQMTTNGQVTTLFSFGGTNGSGPISLMQASDGVLYGTTFYGGTKFTGPFTGAGTVFRITTNGDFASLAMFDNTNGFSPVGKLLEVTGGVFYGTTEDGGKYHLTHTGDGSLYQVTTNGNLTTLVSFPPSMPKIGYPQGGVIEGPDGNFYGPYGSGVFAIQPLQAPVLQSTVQGGQINLTWNSWAGYAYSVVSSTNLTDAIEWEVPVFSAFAQTNGPMSYSETVGPDAQRFYRVILQSWP